MNIIIHDYAGHPFQVQLSRELARRGHRVSHLYAASIETPRGALEIKPDDPGELSIEGVSVAEPFQKHNFFKRRSQELEYGHLVSKRIESIHPDWVISGNTPTEPQATLQKTCQRLDIKFASWVQDFYGIAVHKLLRKKLPVAGEFIGGYYRWLDRRTLRNSDRVILITEDFRPLTDRMGVAKERTSVIENWAPLDELPLRPKDTPWSREHGLNDKFVFLYSGTLGMKHNPKLLLELAQYFADDSEVLVVVITEGIGGDWLKGKQDELKLHNLLLLPYQPFEDFPDVLGSADVLVAILEPDAGVFSVPSKVLSYLCAGKPILASMPSDNLATRIIRKAGAGLVGPPRSCNLFLNNASKLRRDPAMRSRSSTNARQYAKSKFSIEQVTNSFDNAIARIS